jgi:hypothetical protein
MKRKGLEIAVQNQYNRRQRAEMRSLLSTPLHLVLVADEKLEIVRAS